MSNFSPEEVIKQLTSLGPDENPFLFLSDFLVNAMKGNRPNLPELITTGICSFFWFLSLVLNVLSIHWRIKRNETAMFRSAATRFGTFYIPNVAILWNISQVINFVGVQLSVVSVFMDAFTHVQPYSFALRSSMFLSVTLVGWIQCSAFLAGGILTYTNKIQSSRSRSNLRLGLLFNGYSIVMPVLQIASQITFIVLGSLKMARLFTAVDEINAMLLDLAKTWTGGLPLQQLLSLQPEFEKTTNLIRPLLKNIAAWSACLVTTLGIDLITVLPPSVYKIGEMRTQLRQLGRQRASAGAVPHKSSMLRNIGSALMVRQSNELQATAQDDECLAHLLLVDAICRNVIISTVFYCLGAISMIPLSIISIVLLATGTNVDFNLMFKLQTAGLAAVTFYLLVVDFVMFARERLSKGLYNNTAQMSGLRSLSKQSQIQSHSRSNNMRSPAMAIQCRQHPQPFDQLASIPEKEDSDRYSEDPVSENHIMESDLLARLRDPQLVAALRQGQNQNLGHAY